jgi:MFS family permease
VVLVIVTILLKNRNDVVKPTQKGFDTKLLRRVDILLLLSWAFISMFGYIVLLYSLPDFAHSIGLSSGQAATINAILNLGTAIGRPMTGLASDWFGRFEVAGVLTFANGVICFAIWIPTKTFGVLIFFALLSGMIIGVF